MLRGPSFYGIEVRAIPLIPAPNLRDIIVAVAAAAAAVVVQVTKERTVTAAPRRPAETIGAEGDKGSLRNLEHEKEEEQFLQTPTSSQELEKDNNNSVDPAERTSRRFNRTNERPVPGDSDGSRG